MKAIWTKECFIKLGDEWAICRRGIKNKGMVCCMILAYLLGIVTISCAPMSVRTEGMADSVAWKATDLRIIERTVDGLPGEIYAFTLVLKEMEGRGITFTHAKYIITSLEAMTLREKKAVHFKLLPHGELRLPFSYGIKGGEQVGRTLRPISVAWTITLTGKDDQDRPVRITLNTNLPTKPPVQQTTQTTRPSTAERLREPTTVPIQCVGNVILVSATLASKEQATLLLDTGASQTAITPYMARQLGISPTDETPTKMIVVFGGRKIEVPFLPLSSIQVGHALVRNLEVGVAVVHPEAPLVDGVLGGDFLGHFKVTVDRAASRIRFDPLSTVKSQVTEITPEKPVSKPTLPKRTSEERSIQDQEKRLAHIPKEAKDAKIQVVKLRSTPRTMWESDIEKKIAKYNFFLKHKNEVGYFPNDFVDNGNGTITDRTTGLMWEKRGSSSLMYWPQAERYVSRLNKERYLGYRDWRIPTTEELMSLLEQKVNDKGLHIDPIFDARQRECWSSDRDVYGTGMANRSINFYDGTTELRVSTHGTLFWDRCYIRAVRSVK